MTQQPLRALSLRQASNCEQAKEPVCKCRCRGQLHGAKRGGENPDPTFFEGLPEDDPHYTPSAAVKAARRKAREAEQRAAKRAEKLALYQRRFAAMVEQTRQLEEARRASGESGL